MSKHPIIILEGADGTGKTTLAEALGFAYIHCTYDETLIGNMTGYFIGVLNAAKHIAEKQPVVIDRWRISEVVYGTVFRKGPENPWATESLYDMAEEAGATHVFCHPKNKSEYLASFNKLKEQREEMYDSMEKVYDAYEKEIRDFIYDGRADRSWVYDRFDTTVKEQIDFLKQTVLKGW